ncbi:DUF3800 domain-containing protein [Vibrio harveyi]|nr:DUF3800 domain-containing protein [Vibrio harveyi]
MDKMYINFYFDESGSTGYFVVGGFYLFSSSLEEIEEIERKLSKNIYLTEKSIKRYLKLNNMERYDSQSKELKFRTIDHENLIYFFNNLNNYGQENICIISDIKK